MAIMTRRTSLDGVTSVAPDTKNPRVLTIKNIALPPEESEELDESLPEGITRGHSTMREVELTETTYRSLELNPTKKLLDKSDETPEREPSLYAVNPLQIEVTGTNFFRLLAPQYCAKAYIVVDEESGIANRCLIERLPGFQTIDQIHQTRDLEYTAEDLLKKGIAPVLVYNFLLQNNDFRNGNMGLTEDGNFAAIDFDQALWSYPTAALFDTPIDPENPDTLFKGERFPLTLHDLQKFPNLKDANPSQWPVRDIKSDNLDLPQNQRDQHFADLLKSLEDNPIFIKEKYFCLFKFSILFQCKSIISKELEKSMHPDSMPFKIIVDNLHNRALQLQYLLLADEKFIPYRAEINNWFQTIKTETLETHPSAENDLDHACGTFYKVYATAVTQPDQSLTNHAQQAAEQIARSPERRLSLNRTQVESEPARNNITQLEKLFDTLLTKHKKYTAKIATSKQPHKNKETLEFCQQVKTACQHFETQKLAQLFAQPPKIKRGFFNWFSDNRFKNSVADLMKTEVYQKVSTHVKKYK